MERAKWSCCSCCSALLHHRGLSPRSLFVALALLLIQKGNPVQRLSSRLCRVNIPFPSVEIRFENVSTEAEVYVGDRALPTLVNYTRNIIDVRIVVDDRHTCTCSADHLHANLSKRDNGQGSVSDFSTASSMSLSLKGLGCNLSKDPFPMPS